MANAFHPAAHLVGRLGRASPSKGGLSPLSQAFLVSLLELTMIWDDLASSNEILYLIYLVYYCILSAQHKDGSMWPCVDIC